MKESVVKGEQASSAGVEACYYASPYLSYKHASYFGVYEDLLAPFRGREIVLIEIGVLHGGSLFMWRSYLGPSARIIGIDLHPGARRWEQDGFDIFIGSQADPAFWDEVFRAVGMVDVVIDDGGHTNEQQIVTAARCLPHIRDGGMLIVEDVHASYLRTFHNPSRYSFIEWTKRLVDNVNTRFPGAIGPELPYREWVHSIAFYESIVCFRVDRRRCRPNHPVSNERQAVDAEDCRERGSFAERVRRCDEQLAERVPLLQSSAVLRALRVWCVEVLLSMAARLKARRLRHYFGRDV